MEKGDKKKLAIMTATVIILVSLFVLYYKQEKAEETRIESFLQTPTECQELQGNLSMLSEEKLHTVYKTKIILLNSRISPENYLENHPNDVAIRSDVAGDGNTVTVILTNEDPGSLDLK